MALDSSVPRSRRALLTAGLGGLAATVLSALGRPASVRAGIDGDVVLGTSNSATSGTGITNTDSGASFFAATSGNVYGAYGTTSNALGAGVYGYNGGLGDGVLGSSNGGVGVHGLGYGTVGVHGESTSSYGVHGTSTNGIGIYAHSDTGTGIIADSYGDGQAGGVARSVGNSTAFIGYSGNSSAPAPVAKTGLFGYANQDSSARGVFGKSGSGQGVRGQATTGVGGYFSATTGLALQASGRVKLSRSGKASIPAGQAFVDVTVTGGLAGTPLPFANLLAYHAGVYVAAIQPNYPSAGVMRIYLNQAASASVATPVSWVVLG